jgi:hypothetical protein
MRTELCLIIIYMYDARFMLLITCIDISTCSVLCLIDVVKAITCVKPLVVVLQYLK